MKRYAIVAIGYNRPKSMQRLLESLERAIYCISDVPLLISIDNSGNDEVERIARSFIWSHGEKKIITYPVRQGLRKHILHCGDFLLDYDAVAIFEDDIVAAPGYFYYMIKAVERYYDDDRIAGISLYNHLWNVHVNMPFEPVSSQYDTYFIQFAQSWGQIWMKKQWFAFKEWYEKNNEEFGQINGMPAFVCNWPKSSWLKYHIRYCVENDLYFVYPYCSLSTCFADVGEHWKTSDTHLQVSMLDGIKSIYKFPNLSNEDAIIYDSFFERRWLSGVIEGIALSDINVNLYGYKDNIDERRYLLAMKSFPYRIIAKYGLTYRPHEQNLVLNSSGEDIYLYDTHIPSPNIKMKNQDVQEFRYRFKLYGKTSMLMKCVFEKIFAFCCIRGKQ